MCALLMLLWGTVGCGGTGKLPIDPPPSEPIDPTPPAQIWFGPNLGSPDLLTLFADPDSWKHSRNYVSVFRFASEHIMAGSPGTEAPNWGGVGANTYAEFVRVDAFRKLRSWGIKTLLGVGAVKPDTCDGVYALGLARNLIEKVADAGGRVDILGIDEPLPSSAICGMTPREAARVTAWFATSLKADYPHLTIGLYEAYPYSTAQAITEFAGLMAEEGFYPDFLSIDVDRNGNVGNVGNDMTAIAKTMKAAGKPYGQFLWGQMFSDAAGYRASVLSWVDRLTGFARQPDFVQVEGWEVFDGKREIPANLPESDPLSHTNLILETAHRMQIKPVAVAALHIGVKDKRTHKRIAGATVTGADQVGTTNEDGYFGLLLRPGFAYNLDISAPGYVTEDANVLFDGEAELIADLDPIKPPVVKRTGVVRLDGNSLVDEQGVWFAEGFTLMPAIALVHEYPHLAASACELQQYGFDAARVLVVVGGDEFPSAAGPADPWVRLASNPRRPDFAARLARTIDYFYDDCGIRSALTIFGGIAYAPSESEQVRVVHAVLDVIRPRLHKVAWVEVANEMFQNGFGGSAGIQRARRLATQLRAALPPNFPIAISTTEAAPNDGDPTGEMRAMFEGSAANLSTPHFSRATNKVDGPWRAVRQPWEAGAIFSIRGNVDNEPIGPGSSVTSERDTSRLVAMWITDKIARVTGRIFHADAGVWAAQIHPTFLGGHDDGLRGAFSTIQSEPGALPAIESMHKLRAVLPSDLHTWNRTRHGFGNHPFADSFQRSGDHFSQIWPDGITGHGVVRAYASLHGDGRFVVLLSGIRDRIDLRWSRALEADIYSTRTGEWVGRIDASERAQTWRQAVDTDLVVIGRFR
jgi:hypothetical protein